MASEINAPVKKNLDRLDEALNLSQRMVRCAQDSQWQRVSELSSQRLACLEAFFSEPVASEEAADVEARIVNLQSLDRRLSVLCDAEREQLTGQLQHLHNVKKGTAAYHRNR